MTFTGSIQPNFPFFLFPIIQHTLLIHVTKLFFPSLLFPLFAPSVVPVNLPASYIHIPPSTLAIERVLHDCLHPWCLTRGNVFLLKPGCRLLILPGATCSCAFSVPKLLDGVFLRLPPSSLHVGTTKEGMRESGTKGWLWF